MFFYSFKNNEINRLQKLEIIVYLSVEIRAISDQFKNYFLFIRKIYQYFAF